MTKNIQLYFGILVITILALFSLALTNNVSAYGTSAAGAPSCDNIAPGTPYIYSLKALGGGSVELSWSRVERATSWTVAYGTQSGKYIYGVHNFGDSNSTAIKISSLPNGKYYFVLRANNGCAPGAFSTEKNIFTSGGGSSSSQNVTFTTSGTSGGSPTPTISPTPKGKTSFTPSPKPSFSPTPLGGLPTAPSTSLWQRLLNFFNSLFK